MLITENVYYSNESTNNFNEKINEFKKEIDSLKNKFKNEINALNTNKICNSSIILYSTNSTNVNDFIYSEDWKEIDNSIFWYIKTFYDFHATTENVLSQLKSFLYKIDPLLDAAEAVGNFLSTMSDIGQTGIPQIDASIAIGKTVGTFLGLLKQDQEKLEYSKEFIINIFGEILLSWKTKNISNLKQTLEIAKNTLDEIKAKFSILLTLPIAKRKVKLTLKTVDKKYLIAQERYNSYIRQQEWGWGCY